MNMFDAYTKFITPENTNVNIKDGTESKLFELDETEHVEEVEKPEIEKSAGLSDDDVSKIATKLAELMLAGKGET